MQKDNLISSVTLSLSVMGGKKNTYRKLYATHKIMFAYFVTMLCVQVRKGVTLELQKDFTVQ